MKIISLSFVHGSGRIHFPIDQIIAFHEAQGSDKGTSIVTMKETYLVKESIADILFMLKNLSEASESFSIDSKDL